MEDWSRRAAGPSGEVRCGHQVAVRLGPWDIAPSGVVGQPDPEGRWSLVGEVVERDDFWIENGESFRLVLTDRAGRTMRFRDVRKVFNDAKFGVWGAGAPEVIE